MILAIAVVTLAMVALLALVTSVQILYLESMRLRTRDLPSLQFFKETLEDRIGLKIEAGAETYSLIKHTLLVLVGALFVAWFAEGETWSARVFWQGALAAWVAMMVAAYAVPQFVYRRTSGRWLLALVPLLRALAWIAHPGVALMSFFQSLVELTDATAVP
jgi:hypothetical protein